MSLGRELVTAICDDPDAVAALRERLGLDSSDANATAVFTPATLGAQLGRSPRAIRAAIARGELEAVRRGRGWIISSDAVEAWAAAPTSQRSHSPRSTRRRNRDGVMARAMRP